MLKRLVSFFYSKLYLAVKQLVVHEINTDIIYTYIGCL